MCYNKSNLVFHLRDKDKQQVQWYGTSCYVYAEIEIDHIFKIIRRIIISISYPGTRYMPIVDKPRLSISYTVNH